MNREDWFLVGAAILLLGSTVKSAHAVVSKAHGSEWVNTRLQAAMRGLQPFGFRPDVAQAIVAQWAHETNMGKNEFGFNLGGIIALPGEPFFVKRDATTGKQIKWRLYDSLDAGVQGYLRLLQRRYRKAWDMLLVRPHDEDWTRELGRAGYYEAEPHIYSRAWSKRLDQVKRATDVSR